MFSCDKDQIIPLWMSLKLSFKPIDNSDDPGPLLSWLEKLGNCDEHESGSDTDDTD